MFKSRVQRTAKKRRAHFMGMLGLEEIPKPENLTRQQGGCWFRCGEHQVHIGIDPDFRPARKAHAAFVVDTFDDLRVRLRGGGFEVIDDAELAGVRRFFSYDPWGNRLEFIFGDVFDVSC